MSPTAKVATSAEAKPATGGRGGRRATSGGDLLGGGQPRPGTGTHRAGVATGPAAFRDGCGVEPLDFAAQAGRPQRRPPAQPGPVGPAVPAGDRGLGLEVEQGHRAHHDHVTPPALGQRLADRALVEALDLRSEPGGGHGHQEGRSAFAQAEHGGAGDVSLADGTEAEAGEDLPPGLGLAPHFRDP
jgi:hypothetical protein